MSPEELFLAVGEIDDHYIEEVPLYFAKVKRRIRFDKAAMLFDLLGTIIVFSLIRQKHK